MRASLCRVPARVGCRRPPLTHVRPARAQNRSISCGRCVITRTSPGFILLQPGADDGQGFCGAVPNDGSEQQLVRFHGVVPIAFQGATYHIPLDVWLPTQYPAAAPVCFVLPTASLFVRPCDIVDAGGAVALERLGWVSSGQHNLHALADLVARAQQHFCSCPPLFSVQPTHPAPVPHSAPPPRMHDAHPPVPHRTLSATAALHPTPRNDKAEAARQLLELKLHQHYDEHRSAVAAVHASAAHLAAHSAAIDATEARRRAALAQIRENIAVLRATTAQLDAAIAVQAKHDVDVESAVVIEAPAHAQLLALLAEDGALADADYGVLRVCMSARSRPQRWTTRCTTGWSICRPFSSTSEPRRSASLPCAPSSPACPSRRDRRVFTAFACRRKNVVAPRYCSST